MMDFAKRAYDHSFPFDPIVRSLLDTDFYKLLMMQFIWKNFPNERVRFKLTNRTKTIRIAEDIDLDELRQQLDHVRTLRFAPSEIIYLRGQTFYGRQGIFEEGYLNTLRAFHLPDYELDYERDAEGNITGQISLTFSGLWWQVSLWEIYALTIINELRYRKLMRGMKKSQLDIMYARAKVKLYAKLERLATVSDLNFSDFGTRRRHSFLWQEHCVLTACEVLGDRMKGTSNVYLAMAHGLEAIGTNAHELAMAMVEMARQRYPDDPQKMIEAQYELCKKWQNQYHENLLVFLPDAYGTTQFLKNAPQWLANWRGARPDSKDPYEGGEELIAWWKRNGVSDEGVKNRLIIFADGLDVEIDGKSNGHDIIAIHDHFKSKVGPGFGMGTNLTNDFIGCHPVDPDLMRPISIVVKIDQVNGHGAVKLSDNYDKATGLAADIEAYREVFGTDGVKNAPVLV